MDVKYIWNAEKILGFKNNEEKEKYGLQLEKKPLILVVDDDLISLTLAQVCLEKYFCDVNVINEGVSVVEKIIKYEYDTIFMDCLMPKIDGFEITKRIREIEKYSGFKNHIVAITGSEPISATKYGLDAGMDDFLSKPLQLERLLMSIRVL